ncbi:DEAD/DEAH box helicase [Streptomyces monomycini]|uniref:DEAD/DEAH box helicase n=1 Tax=Streptomyces monomycini TaxID=371720 RepID=UPI0004AA88EB|nr:DEAD/DEAH box helicase [Streptomyces monomycini]
MALLPSAPSAPPAALAHRAAVFLPGDPARTGQVAFWRADGTADDEGTGWPTQSLTVAVPTAPGPGDSNSDGSGNGSGNGGGDGGGDGGRNGDGIELIDVPAVVLPVADALPVLTRARAARTSDPAAAFWGAAAVLALQLVARGRLLPGVSRSGHDAWRVGPLDPDDVERLRELAASLPPQAHAVPLSGSPGSGPVLLPDPERLVRDFLDAVADGLPRSPAAALVTGGPAFAAPEPQHIPEQRDWAADVAAGHDAGVRISLRVEITGLPGTAPDRPGAAAVTDRTATGRAGFTAVLQLHDPTDPALVADAAEVWAGDSPTGQAFGPRARMDTLLTLRRAAAAWAPLTPLLSAAVPDAVDLADEEIAELLGPATRALAAAGVQVHWPRDLVRGLSTRAVVGPSDQDDAPPHAQAGPDDDAAGQDRAAPGVPSFLSADALLSFSWRFAVGDQEISRAELDRLAESGRPLVRLRDQWVLVDPEALRAARDRQDRKVTPIDALGAALTGTAESGDGARVEVQASGWLARLRDRLTAPDTTASEATAPDTAIPEASTPDTAVPEATAPDTAGPDTAAEQPIAQPPALTATLRDYQLRGLDWLHRMTSLGLGGCLADDMGLGKTITLIALHLHRQSDPASAGPTLVVCPASLMGNWQREIEKFAPGTPVRRFHADRRSLADLADGGFVLTTYGTMRLDAAKLATTRWGLVVADEAQHVKNPFSATAKALRRLPAGARVALTGTPVENNLSELWAILDWTTPGLLGSLGRFRERYATAVEGGADPAAADRLARLVRPFLLRRRKSDPGIAPELPPKTETDRAVALTKEQAGLYEAVVREGLGEIAAADGLARRGLVVKLLTSLKQICNHPAQFLKEERPLIAGRSGKLELLDELLETILAEDAGVLVFTQYVRMARLLETHLAGRGVPTQLLHGGTPVARREEMVRRFQDGAVPVFLLSLKAAGTGLNLTRAAHVVHYDRWWNPAVEAQATDRAYRIGQTRPVQVHRMIAEGTVEDRIAGLLARKQRLADAVLGSGEAALTELTDAELADLVALRGSER